MNVAVKEGSIADATADTLIVNLFRDVTTPGGATGAVDQALGGMISSVIAAGDHRGTLGETIVLYPQGAIAAKRVIVVGLGAADGFSLEAVREAAGSAIKVAHSLAASSVSTIVHGAGIGGLDPQAAAQATIEGSLLALYQYDAPRTLQSDEKPSSISELTIVEFDAGKIDQIEAGARHGQIIADATCVARDLVNRPSNVATPTAIAETALAICTQSGMRGVAHDEAWMREQGMGLLLAVTQGATQPAHLIVMEHRPEGAANQQPIVLVGKGVAFDTGGYSLKSARGMLGMKGDMGGAAAVIGAMQAIAQLDVPLFVVGIVPTVENVVSATSFKPNDVFAAMNKVSVEISSTDAEGRLILADALCYAGTLDPALVIDVATLTGGKITALGNRTNALFSNNDPLSDALLAAGRATGEPLWRLPLDADYDRQLKSDVADLKNSGGPPASAVTAARFLAYFTGEWDWAHLDIAGSEMSSGGAAETPRSYVNKGATGNPLRTLVAFVRDWSPAPAN